jgi:hypothetical protein
MRRRSVVERQIEELNDDLECISATNAGLHRIRQIPGGPIVSCPKPPWVYMFDCRNNFHRRCNIVHRS